MDILQYQQLIPSREEVVRLRTENTALKERIEQLERRQRGDGEKKQKKKTKPYYNLCRTARFQRKRRLEESIAASCQENLPEEVQRIRVEITLKNGLDICLHPFESAMVSSDSNKCPPDILHKIINIKDKFRISDEAMHELHMVKANIPSKNQLQEEKKRLSTVIPIRQYPGVNEDCAFRHLSEVLDYVIPSNQATHSITCRFSCDGANITKRKGSVRGVIKVLHPRDQLPDQITGLSMSPEDELTLFFFMGEESRGNMEKYSKQTFQEMQNASAHGIQVAENTIRINWILTCDWKALTILKGINSANSKYFCIWCHCPKSQICDFSINTWDIQRSEKCRDDYLGKRDHFGYHNQDLCSFIPFTQVVPDDLHLRIRISLKLFNQVVIWSIDQHKEKELQLEMDRISVPFSFWEIQGDNNCGAVKKWSQPSGDELQAIIRKTIISNILDNGDNRRYITVEGLSVEVLKDELRQRGLQTKGKKTDLVSRLKQHLEPNEKFLKKSKSRLRVSYNSSDDEEDSENSLDVDAIQDLWSRFDQLMDALRQLPSSPSYLSPETFKETARKWAEDFRKFTFDEDVTPYIHCLVYHIPQFLLKYKYLHDIGVSQVERKNYDHRVAYFASTNRGGGKSKKKISLQILERENRLLWARNQGIERTKRTYNKRPLTDI